MLRVQGYRVARADFDDASEVHDRDARRHMLNEREVVRNEEVGKTACTLELFKERHDLSLNRNVEGARGLVENEEFRLEGNGPCDRDSLALATGKCRGKTLKSVGTKAHLGEKFADPRLRCTVIFCDPVNDQRLGDDALDRMIRIQARVWVLKYDLHTTTQRAKFAL